MPTFALILQHKLWHKIVLKNVRSTIPDHSNIFPFYGTIRAVIYDVIILIGYIAAHILAYDLYYSYIILYMRTISTMALMI